MSVKPNYHLNVSLNYSRNDIALANGDAITNLVGARVVYGFSPRSFFNAYLQSNSATREVSTNVRFNLGTFAFRSIIAAGHTTCVRLFAG